MSSMRSTRLLAVALALAAVAWPGAGPERAQAGHPKRCGIVARGSADYRVRARTVRCSFAKRWVRAYLSGRSRPRRYSCLRPGGGIAFYCKRGSRSYWAERL